MSPRVRSLFFPRASVPVTSPMAWNNVLFSELATPQICGKLVATPSRATPWSASDHQLYRGQFTRGTAAAEFTNRPAFSSLVRFATRAAARSAKLDDMSHHLAAFMSPSHGPV